MKKIKILWGYLLFSVLCSVYLLGCQATAPAGPDATANATTADSTATEAPVSLAPKRVDLRGTITRRVYDRGQVTIEVEGFTDVQQSRYSRGYVLVTPTTQIISEEGRTISLSELYEGQNVAILMRGGGRGNFVGLGVARKMWIEPRF
ncbi:hypothetical protein [Rufibacter immobilis]|uniref:hypothetical protein n=1 Tax=Rufibacter immobilis TaxID=1348778 RepID=UPI0035EF4660